MVMLNIQHFHHPMTKLSRTFCHVLPILVFLHLVSAQLYDIPTANRSTTWINSVSAPFFTRFSDGTTMIPILLTTPQIPSLNTAVKVKYGCGFIGNGRSETFFAIFLIHFCDEDKSYPFRGIPQVIWAANRSRPVRTNATLQLTGEGDLILRDADGALAWYTKTTGKSVAGLNLSPSGNLGIFDSEGSFVWQSWNHPKDCLVLGQRLEQGLKLTSGASTINSSRIGSFSLSLTDEGLFASIESDPPQVYFKVPRNLNSGSSLNSGVRNYIQFWNGSLEISVHSVNINLSIPLPTSVQFMKLDPDGHLRVYEAGVSGSWKEVADLFTEELQLGQCNYPTVCGRNSICSKGQCRCPQSPDGRTLSPINNSQPNLGCYETNPLTCSASHSHSLLELDDVNYFAFQADINDTDKNSCKEACLRNCSCRAAIFHYSSNSSLGDCYLPSEIFSFMTNDKSRTGVNSSVFLKVQIEPGSSSTHVGKKRHPGAMLGSAIGASAFVTIAFTIFAVCKKKNARQVEEDHFDHVPGMPDRFSYADLEVATKNFSKKLGEGGFASVFEGSLKDGTRIAVKCLDGVGRIKKSFLAEVESIGRTHHVNLVRLIGFCAEKSLRLLVYEYMSNGSLDRWIYDGSRKLILDWKTRRKIIKDIAKGIAYLHEDCRHKIIHSDIKPENILLDEHHSAKISDFGLSKLIDRNQSQVVTMLRGTPGYMAPEWLMSSSISEKVDVYSFGIVVLEILCGRKNFDVTKPQEERHLLTILKEKAKEGKLSDMIDENSEDLQSHQAEVLEMLQIAIWCLQGDYTTRPSMSVVVKILEGVPTIEQNIDYGMLDPEILANRIPDVAYVDASQFVPSVLSGPR